MARSAWRVAVCALSLVAIAGAMLVTSPARSQTVEPECDVVSETPIPASFAGCRELEARVRDAAAFDGPDGFDLAAYEDALNDFLSAYCHRDAGAGWERDKRVRDVGPYAGILDGASFDGPKYFGTHAPVLIWYSPDMAAWIKRHRPAEGEGAASATPPAPPAGAIMIKEMYPSPAARCAGEPAERLEPTGVALMVHAPALAQDGWFWGFWDPSSPGEAFVNDWPAPAGNRLPYMGFGQYCVNCHASARDFQTFADAKNIEGQPGEPNVYLSQNFLFENDLAGPDEGHHDAVGDTSDDPARHDAPLAAVSAAFARRFRAPSGDAEAKPVPFASQTYDNVWIPGGGPTAGSMFVTSDQCIGCHDAGSTGLQFDMTAPDPRGATLLNLSPYGSWRDSPMGLGGRDPIFYAQLASETDTFHPALAVPLQDICFGCHGVQGQRQRAIDELRETGECGDFTRPIASAVPWPREHNPLLAEAPYGGLARDGIACTACHHMALEDEEIRAVRGTPQNECVERRQANLNPDNKGFARTFTGSYFVGRPAQLAGPFTAPKIEPMKHALGIEPIAMPKAIKSSELCGSCHTVHLPVYRDQGDGAYGDPTELLGRTYEQTTYPEWAFSAYRTGTTPNGDLPHGRGDLAKSCQECHMPSSSPERGLFTSKIASIQEYSNFPRTDNTLGPEDIDLPVRPGFAVHTLVGLNVFFNAMAQQFPEILGIRTQDPMMGGNGLDPVKYTERAMLAQASNDTAAVSVHGISRQGGTLRATVTVRSVTGHKLPSGVGFRRAFLEVAVLDAGQDVLWASGRTDGAGVIVDEEGRPIEGELWWTADCSARLPGTPHQPHYQTIDRQDRAQIYQELVTTAAPVPDPSCGYEAAAGGHLTTSFLSICGHVKDNRILPDGFLGLEQRVEIAEALGAHRDLAEDTGPWAVDGDPDYVGGGGDSLVYEVPLAGLGGEPAFLRATLYYQAIPPFYLQDRFCTSQSEDTRRLHFLAGHLDLEGRMEDWKLEVVDSGLVVVD